MNPARRAGLAPASWLLACASLASCAQLPAPAPSGPPAPPAQVSAQAPAAPAVTAPPPPVPAAPAFRIGGEPTFDIGLAVDADSLRIEPAGAVVVSWRAPGGEPGSAQISDPLLVRVSGAQALVEPVGRPRAVPLAVLELKDTLWVGGEPLERADDARLVYGGRHWRGRFKIFFSPRGRLTLATRVTLEHYLLGVVPGEIGGLRDSLLEAGRAQAIAARSYSLFYRGRRGAEGFDLYATVEDQVYGPVESERALASRCVQGTRGVVSTSNGAPIRANYCSTCGGITAEVWEAWPTEPRSYLVSVADHAEDGDYCSLSPQYRWREEWSAADFAGTIARYASAQNVPVPDAGVGEIRDVNVTSRSRSGRVWRLTITTSTGRIEIPAYAIRQVLRRPGGSGAILRSNLFKIAMRRGADGRAVAVIASGAGSGHGVGLCQTGAIAMARAGASADAILSHYYAGTKLAKLY